MGEKVYMMGAFPDIKNQNYQIILDIRLKTQLIKEDVQKQLLELITVVKDIEPTLSSIPRDCKVEHPGLGYLHAAEWFQLIFYAFLHIIFVRKKDWRQKILV